MKRLFGVTQTFEDVVASKDAAAFAKSLKEKLGEPETVKLLQGTLAVLCPSSASSGVDALVTAPADAKVEDQLPAAGSLPLDEIVLTLPGISFVAPHGRHDCIMTEDSIFLKSQSGKKALIPPIPLADVKHLLKLPKLEAMRAAGAPAKTYWLVLVLEHPITVGKQIHKCVVMKLEGVKVPSSKLQAPSLGPKSCARRDRCERALREALEAEEAVVVSAVVAACVNATVLEPEASVCILEGAEARAERGELGVLYPLRSGLAFLPKPAIFVPGDDILEAQAGTGAPGGEDLIIHRESGGEVRFQSVASSDLKALLSYFATLAPKIQNGNGASDTLWPEEDDGSDFEDEDARPAKRRVVTRSQTCAEKAAGKTPDLVQDLRSGSQAASPKVPELAEEGSAGSDPDGDESDEWEQDE